MTYVTVDTNNLMRDYLLIEGTVQTFLLGCRRCHISVHFSEVVLDELAGNFNRDVAKAVTQVQSLTRKLQRMEALDGIAARIRAGDFDSFDLTDGLTNLFIAELCNKYNPLDETGTPLDEPSVESVGEAHVAELDVSRLDEDQLLIELSGRIELELSGFIQKSDLYLMDEQESEDIYVSDPDWNDHVVQASTSREFHFEMTVVFDETDEKVDSVTIKITPLGDMEGEES